MKNSKKRLKRKIHNLRRVKYFCLTLIKINFQLLTGIITRFIDCMVFSYNLAYYLIIALINIEC